MVVILEYSSSLFEAFFAHSFQCFGQDPREPESCQLLQFPMLVAFCWWLGILGGRFENCGITSTIKTNQQLKSFIALLFNVFPPLEHCHELSRSITISRVNRASTRAHSNCTSSTIIRRHQLVPLNTLGEISFSEMSSMRPRLQSILLPNSLRKASTPLHSRIRLHHTLNRRLIHQLRIPAHVIKYSSKLDQGSNPGQSPGLTKVLMPDHSFGYILGLLDGCGVGLEQVESEEAAVEFEGH